MHFSRDKAEAIILKQKSTLLTSYITENFFVQDFIKPADVAYSTDWWYTETFDKAFMFVVKERLTALDYHFAKQLKAYDDDLDDLSVFQIQEKNSQYFICDIHHPNNLMTIEQFAKQFQLWKKTPSPCGANEEEEACRKRVLAYLKSHHLCSEIASISNLSEMFFNQYFASTTNIDLIMENELGILVFEIKCKYPDYQNRYGINVFQYHLMKKLEDAGIKTYNAILKNSEKMNLVDFVFNYDENKAWYYSRIDTSRTKINVAPKKTALYRNKEQKYYAVSAKKYQKLERQNNIVDLKCPKCGADMTIRSGPYGSFLACQNYPATRCTGVLKFS